MPAKRQKQRPRKPDSRVRRTNQRLGSALVELILQKPINDVTVQEVLDRAAVGRSTFYLHFRDKNDLLLTQLETFLEKMSTHLARNREKSDRVIPVAEMFAHIGTQNRIYIALAESGGLRDFFDLAQGYFARAIEERLKASARLPKIKPEELAVRAFALAGALLALLRWWIDRGGKESPKQVDELFHRMVWDGLAPVSDKPKTGRRVARSSLLEWET